MEPLRSMRPSPPRRQPSDNSDSHVSTKSPIVTVESCSDSESRRPSPIRRHSSDPEAQDSSPEERYAARRMRRRTDRWSWKVWRYMNMRQRRSIELQLPMDSKVLGVGAGEGLLVDSKTDAEKSRRIKSRVNYFTFCSISGLTISAIILALNLGLIVASTQYKVPDIDPFFELWGAPKTGTEGLSWYPTDFTRDILPIACHSHNDYWRRVPLFSAIRAGCIGTEADVWLIDNDLFVGHNRASLTVERSFRNLYIDPLVKILERQNAPSEFYNGTANGVFDENPEQTLTLLVDVKTDGASTWPWVLEQLEPLRARNWLSYVENGVLHQRAVTVVGTGNAPFDLLTSNTTYRDAFFDAPLSVMWEPLTPASTSSIGASTTPSGDTNTDTDIDEALLPTPLIPAVNAGQGMTGVTSLSSFTSENSYYASVSFPVAIGPLWRGRITPKQLKIIRGHVRGAHRRGLKVRYWDLPGWPLNLRNHVWDVLVREGVDLLNVDDLRGASKVAW